MLGHPCRSHLRGHIPLGHDTMASIDRTSGCGIDDCPNPTLHSHSERQKAARAAQREEIEAARQPIDWDGDWVVPTRRRTARSLATCPYVCPQTEEHTHTEESGIQRRYGPHQHVSPGHEGIEGKAYVGKTDCGHPVSHRPHDSCSGLLFEVQGDMVSLSEVPGLPGFNPDLSPHLVRPVRPSIEPEEIDRPSGHQPGDWVLVWAQVVGDDTHPEDLGVRLWSHNADWKTAVLREHVNRTDALPADATQCTHLAIGQRGLYIRCERYLGRGHEHVANGKTWTDGESVGYIEEA